MQNNKKKQMNGIFFQKNSQKICKVKLASFDFFVELLKYLRTVIFKCLKRILINILKLNIKLFELLLLQFFFIPITDINFKFNTMKNLLGLFRHEKEANQIIKGYYIKILKNLFCAEF